MKRRAVLLGAATLCSGVEALADSVHSEALFVIARSKNANVVHYAARVHQNGRLDPDEPIVAYWIMHAEDGRREALTWLEQKFAYGFTTALAPGGDALNLRLKAFSRRELAVRPDENGRFHAEMTVAARRARLERIFVASDESGLTPSVRYVDLFARLPEGARVSERILP
ncbi:MAG TPA: DUF4833 domain-containing protein [Polyangiaceae bacterium]|nr:DUF4833 domain-containing protein [Polyangiaceae bacterium]